MRKIRMLSATLIFMVCIILASLLTIGGVASAQYYTVITDASHPSTGGEVNDTITADNGIPFYCLVDHNAGILEVHDTAESVWLTDFLELDYLATKAHFLVYSAFSVTVPNNTYVAALTIYYEDGDSESLDLIEGINIAEWAYDRPENQPYLMHDKVPPAYSWMTHTDSEYWYEGHAFYISIDLEPKPLNGVALILNYCPTEWFAVRVAGMTLETICVEGAGVTAKLTCKSVTACITPPPDYAPEDIVGARTVSVGEVECVVEGKLVTHRCRCKTGDCALFEFDVSAVAACLPGETLGGKEICVEADLSDENLTCPACTIIEKPCHKGRR